tara:strand:+ start:1046 stop:1561 length:516 start_codon:yes stop_codon:yes gene_type:complete
MELEADWLMKLEKEDQKYAEFYREKVRDIDIYCLYIDQKNQLKFGHKQNYHIHNHIIDKDELLYIIKKNVEYNSVKYKPFSLIKYNFTLNPSEIRIYLDDPSTYNFLTTEKIDTIKFDDTIELFKELNSLYILYYEPHNLPNTNKTKKIFINNKKLKKKRQTKRKPLKALQ